MAPPHLARQDLNKHWFELFSSSFCTTFTSIGRHIYVNDPYLAESWSLANWTPIEPAIYPKLKKNKNKSSAKSESNSPFLKGRLEQEVLRRQECKPVERTLVSVFFSSRRLFVILFFICLLVWLLRVSHGWGSFISFVLCVNLFICFLGLFAFLFGFYTWRFPMDEAASFLFLWRITSCNRLFTSGLEEYQLRLIESRISYNQINFTPIMNIIIVNIINIITSCNRLYTSGLEEYQLYQANRQATAKKQMFPLKDHFLKRLFTSRLEEYPFQKENFITIMIIIIVIIIIKNLATADWLVSSFLRSTSNRT